MRINPTYHNDRQLAEQRLCNSSESRAKQFGHLACCSGVQVRSVSSAKILANGLRRIYAHEYEKCVSVRHRKSRAFSCLLG